MNQLERLSGLIAELNQAMAQIAELIGRPAQIGHVGEYIAAAIFGIELEESAASKSIDGHFAEGRLAGKTVNIKWYSKWEGLLALKSESPPDYYLVMTGPKAAAVSSRGKTRPWCIESVLLFDGRDILAKCQARGVKISVATSVRKADWTEAEVYPEANNPTLVLTEKQRRLLALFAPNRVA